MSTHLALQPCFNLYDSIKFWIICGRKKTNIFCVCRKKKPCRFFFFVTMDKMFSCALNCSLKNIKTGFWKMLGWTSVLLAVEMISSPCDSALPYTFLPSFRHDNLRLGGLVVPSVWAHVIDSAEPRRCDLFHFYFSDSDLILIKICLHLRLFSLKLW